jgi:hypothetical protein
MAENLAKYSVELLAETAKYRAELAKANNAMKKFAGDQQKMLATIRSGFVGLAGVLGIREVAQWAKGIVDSGDAALEMSQKIGISVETLTGLESGLKQSGSSLKQFETGMRGLARAQVAAIQGGEKQAKAFAAVGVGIDQLKTADLEQLLRAIADEFSRTADGASKAALAQQFFTKSGMNLIPFLNEGSKGIDEYIRKTKELGGAWTTDGARAADRFNDSLTVLGQVAKGYGIAIAQSVLPYLNRFVVFLIDSKEKLESFSSSLGGMFEWVNEIPADFLRVKSYIEGISDAASTYANLLLNRVIPGTEAWREAMRSLADRDQLRELLLAGDLADLGSPDAGGSDGAIDKRIQDLMDLINAQADLEAQTKATADALRDEAQVMSMFQDITDDTTRFLKDGEAEVQSMFQALVEHEAGKMRDAAKATKDAMAQMTEFANQAARNIQDAFADFLFDPFEDGLKGMLDNFLNTIRRMVAEIAAQQILAGVFGGLAGSGNSFLASLGTAFGGARAAGGPVSAGTSYLVGERGPEIFTPAAAGRITPNGGGGVRVNINNYGPPMDAGDVQTQTMNGETVIDALVQRAVGKMFATGAMERQFAAAGLPMRRPGRR